MTIGPRANGSCVCFYLCFLLLSSASIYVTCYVFKHVSSFFFADREEKGEQEGKSRCKAKCGGRCNGQKGEERSQVGMVKQMMVHVCKARGKGGQGSMLERIS